MTLPHRATVRLSCGSDEAARRALAALAPDNGGHLAARTEVGGVLVLEAGSDSPMGLLRTLDDALACLRAALPTI